jgi:hypothetical protein
MPEPVAAPVDDTHENEDLPSSSLTSSGYGAAAETSNDKSLG